MKKIIAALAAIMMFVPAFSLAEEAAPAAADEPAAMAEAEAVEDEVGDELNVEAEEGGWYELSEDGTVLTVRLPMMASEDGYEWSFEAEDGSPLELLTNETTTVTHRIIGITEKYGDTGQRAFQTQGVMNASPDSQLVPAANVVGKVVFHSLTAGKIAAFLESYWPLLLFFIIVIAVLIRVLKHIYRKDGGRTDKENQKRGKRFFLAKAIQTQSKEEQT